MSTASRTTPLTTRAFLFSGAVDTAAAIGAILSTRGIGRSVLRAMPHLSPSAVESIDIEVGNIVDGLLDQDIGEIFVSCWRKHRALEEAGRRTLADPGSEEVVALATRRATATYSPSVDLFIDGIKANTFDFVLTVMFDVTGVAAVVRLGRLVGLRGGDCVVTVTLTLEGGQLARRQAHVDPATVVDLHRGITLVDGTASDGMESEPA